MNWSYIIAAAVALGTAAWVFSGEISGPNQASGSTAQPISAPRPGAPVPAVRVQQSRAEPHLLQVLVRGRSAALRRIEIKAEVQARVVELPVAKGQPVRRGDVIARLAMDDRGARLAEAKALLRQREVEFAAATELAGKGYRAANTLVAGEALLDGARAAVNRLEVEIARTVIVAPFDGVLEDRAAELGSFLKVGDPVATLVDGDPFLIIGQVSEREVGQLTLGQPGTATLVDGSRFEGRLRYLATTADPATRTFRLELEVPNPQRLLRDGMTAEIRLPLRRVPAHLLSPAVLTLNQAGEIGLRAVGADSRVRFHAVRILDDGPAGVWLGGLPEELDVIVVGHEFVADGELVAPQPMASPPAAGAAT